MKRVNFPCGHITLEGVLHRPDAPGPFPGVVVCHPHPLYGGTMDSPVILSICRALKTRGIASLRFNFRGVGRSEGSYAEGVGEREDARAALDFLSQQEVVDRSRLGLCGYSFGTIVGLPVADQDDRVKALAGVSPFFSSPELLQNFHRPKFFICGSRDDFVDLEELRRRVAELPEPKELEIIPGADHFWWGYVEELSTKVADFFAAALVSPD